MSGTQLLLAAAIGVDAFAVRLYNRRAMADPIYVYTKVIRAGLGNNLVAWARAELFAREHGLKSIAPYWFHFKLGPILRRERDWRWYGALFHNGDAIGGPRRWWLLKRGEVTVETDDAAERLVKDRPSVGRPQIAEFSYNYWRALAKPVMFEQMGHVFEALIPHADFLGQRLRSIVRREHLAVVDATFNEPFIGIHYRRGDKPPLAFGTPYPIGSDHPTLPAEWYVAALRSVRERLGFDAPAIVFTDAKPEQAALLLAQPNVQLAGDHNAIVDLLLMAKSRIFISTFSSSFSHWSAMLGKMPSVHYPGRSFQTVAGRPQLTLFTTLSGDVGEEHATVFCNAMK